MPVVSHSEGGAHVLAMLSQLPEMQAKVSFNLLLGFLPCSPFFNH